MNNLPLLNDLRVFMLVARRAGFAAVAEELGVSPLEITKCGGESRLLTEYLFEGEDAPHA